MSATGETDIYKSQDHCPPFRMFVRRCDIFNMAMPIFREVHFGQSALMSPHISTFFLIFPALSIHVPRNPHLSEVSVVRIPVSLYFRTLSTAFYPQMEYGGLCAISLSEYCSWVIRLLFSSASVTAHLVTTLQGPQTEDL